MKKGIRCMRVDASVLVGMLSKARQLTFGNELQLAMAKALDLTAIDRWVIDALATINFGE